MQWASIRWWADLGDGLAALMTDAGVLLVGVKARLIPSSVPRVNGIILNDAQEIIRMEEDAA